MGRKAQPVLAEIGATGLKHHGGRLSDEWHPKLTGALGAKIFREMSDSSPIIGSFILLAEMLVRQASWDIKPAADTAESHEVAHFVETCRRDMDSTWSEIISQAMSSLVYGWSFLEVIFKVRNGDSESKHFRSRHEDGRIGWRDMSIRGQESIDRWEFDPDGNVIGLHQRPAPDYKPRYIPLSKGLHFKLRSQRGNPEGRSFLRNAHRPWHFARRLQDTEAIGCTKNLNGTLVVRCPPEILSSNATAAQVSLRNSLERKLSLVQAGEYTAFLFPGATTADGKQTGYDIELLTGSAKPIDCDSIIRRYESRILISTLSEFLLLGQDKVGSFALVSGQTNMFSLAIGAILDIIVEEFNSRAIPDLMRLNGIPEALWPTLTHGDVEDVSLQEFVNYVTASVQAGILIPDDALEEHVRRRAKLPSKDPEADTILDRTEQAQQADDLEGLFAA